MNGTVKGAPFLSNRVLIPLSLLLFIAGIIGLIQRFATGHTMAGYGSFVPWGLWVAIYFHGVGIAGGSFLIGVWLYIFDFPLAREIRFLRSVIVLGAASIMASFMAVGLDLGHMERAYRIFIYPSFTSMMTFNAWMYTLFLIFSFVAWYLTYRDNSGWLKPVLIFTSLLSIAFPSQSGAFFGVVEAKPFWHSALLPVLFLTSALVSGSALLMIIANWFATRNKSLDEEYIKFEKTIRFILIISMTLYFVFEWAEFSISIWNPEIENEAISLILTGPYAWIFWFVHLLIGGVVPYVMLLANKRELYPWAALLVGIAFISTRLNILLPGQSVIELKGLEQAFSHLRLTHIYHPTLMEYLVGALILFTAIFIFFAGNKISLLFERYAGGRRDE